jgi:hypothetical protein
MALLPGREGTPGSISYGPDERTSGDSSGLGCRDPEPTPTTRPPWTTAAGQPPHAGYQAPRALAWGNGGRPPDDHQVARSALHDRSRAALTLRGLYHRWRHGRRTALCSRRWPRAPVDGDRRDQKLAHTHRPPIRGAVSAPAARRGRTTPLTRELSHDRLLQSGRLLLAARCRSETKGAGMATEGKLRAGRAEFCFEPIVSGLPASASTDAALSADSAAGRRLALEACHVRNAGLAELATPRSAVARAGSCRVARRSPRSLRDRAPRPWLRVRVPRRTCALRRGRTR